MFRTKEEAPVTRTTFSFKGLRPSIAAIGGARVSGKQTGIAGLTEGRGKAPALPRKDRFALIRALSSSTLGSSFLLDSVTSGGTEFIVDEPHTPISARNASSWASPPRDNEETDVKWGDKNISDTGKESAQTASWAG